VFHIQPLIWIENGHFYLFSNKQRLSLDMHDHKNRAFIRLLQNRLFHIPVFISYSWSRLQLQPPIILILLPHHTQ